MPTVDYFSPMFKLYVTCVFFTDGASMMTLNNCKNGQKLIVLVMAVRQPIPKAAPPPASILPPQKIPATDLTSPAPTPTTDKSGSGRVGVSVSVGIVFMFIAFVGLV